MEEIDLLEGIENSWDESHHIRNGKPIYEKRFTKVMNFHKPGIAAVLDGNEAYHIKLDGTPLYTTRFERTFGFYEGMAAVKDESGWYHIDVSGNSIYKERYGWVGNFQEGRCVVKSNNKYFHIMEDGPRAYPQSYKYAGDYKYGIAVVYKENGMATHIDKNGNEMHGKEYIEVGVFHKGYAIARDKDGFFHLSEDGIPLYQMRYEWIEPFYNNMAFGRKHDGSLVVLDEETLTETPIREINNTYCKELARERIKKKLVGYWDTQILYCIAKTEVLDKIKEGYNTKEKLSQLTNIPGESIQMLLDILKIWGLIIFKQNRIEITASGETLTEGAEDTLKYAAVMWGEEHYNTMRYLLKAIKEHKPQFKKTYGQEYFNYISNNREKAEICNKARETYSADYLHLLNEYDFNAAKIILDVGGGSGRLLDSVLKNNPHVGRGILLDLPGIIRNNSSRTKLDPRIQFVMADFFKDRLPKADTVILSRILHDWNDRKAQKILKNIYGSLSKSGRLLIFETIMPEEKIKDIGTSLNFNLLVMVGGKERTLKEFETLLNYSGLSIERIIQKDSLISLLICKKDGEK